MIEMAPPENEEEFNLLVDWIVEQMSEGKGIMAHCRGGIGRAGLLASCVLLKTGVVSKGNEAIKKVRKLRDKR